MGQLQGACIKEIILKENQKKIVMKVNKMLFSFVLFLLVLNYILIYRVIAEQPDPSLSAIVLFGMPSVKEIKQNKNLEAHSCLQKYLKAISARSFLLSDADSSDPEGTLNYRRRNLEEQIVVIIGDKARGEAQDFAKTVPLSLEWEGMSENPLNEANFVDIWLDKHPGTSIAPFLYLFKSHRLRASYEAAKAAHEKGLWPILAVKYKESLEKALSFNNPLISCIIKDMEAQAYVYLEGYGRP